MSAEQLGYLVFEVSDVAAWERFGTQVLGLEVSERYEGGGFALRMDSRRARIFIEPGAADDLAAMGWQVRDRAALDALATTLRARNVDVVEATPAQCATRFVEAMIRFPDPAGVPCEAFVNAARVDAPFHSKVLASSFIAEELGMGHLVVNAKDPEQSKAFYCDVLGLRLSDRIVANIHGYQADLSFFHANARHHSIAFGNPQRKRLHHFMVEVRSFDDVGLAFDRTLREGLRIMQTLGRHPNDRMFSFYAKTPSGFQFEFGYGGREVDDATWQPTTYDRISEWGHHPPQFLAQVKP